MFGEGGEGVVDWENTSKAVGGIWGFLCVFLGRGVLVPILESAGSMVGVEKGQVGKKVNFLRKQCAEEDDSELMVCNLGVPEGE